jgi:diadenosine tetraphosphate (Ap4A) HIT family hydrolase
MTRTADGFELDYRLAQGSVPIGDWRLCHVRLKDDRRVAWLLLMPRRPGIVELTDLEPEDYRTLWDEALLATRLVVEVARPDKTNVASLGNVVAQMHVHIVGRFRHDPVWPDPIWGRGEAQRYRPAELEAMAERYRATAAALSTR